MRVRTVSASVFAALLGCAGAALAVAAAGPSEGETTLGRASADVRPFVGAPVDLYVPIADWGIRAEAPVAPAGIRLELRSLDRDEATRALSAGWDARDTLDRAAAGLRALAVAELRRALLLAAAGALAGALLAAAVLRPRGRALAAVLAAGLALPAGLAGWSAAALSSAGARVAEEPAFYARGDELPKLLALGERVSEQAALYRSGYTEALESLERLVAASGDGEWTRTAVLASDLHANPLPLPAFARYARGRTVFFAGDLTQVGSRYEEPVAERLASLAGRLVAVSGNHDSRPLMRALAAAGATVLTREGLLRGDGGVDGPAVRTIDGIRVAGFDDPAERTGELLAAGGDLRGEALARAGEEIVAWFRSLPERPRIVLVHNVGLARALLESVGEDEDPLLVLTGHDHVQRVESNGRSTLVDAGTLGAGGAFELGRSPAGFALLRLRGSELLAVDLVEAEPVSGAASARRHVVASTPAADALSPAG